MSQLQTTAKTVAHFTRPVRFRTDHCGLVARRLALAAPQSLTDWQASALEEVQRSAEALAAVLKKRQRVRTPRLREPRNALITAWVSLHRVLSSIARVPAALNPPAAAASDILAALFPAGVRELRRLDAPGVWSLSRIQLERTQEEAIAEQLEELVGPALLDAVAVAHQALGVELRADGGSRESAPARRGLYEAGIAFAYSVTRYARLLSGSVDPQRPETLTEFREALAAIDEFCVVRTAPRALVGASGVELREQAGRTRP